MTDLTTMPQVRVAGQKSLTLQIGPHESHVRETLQELAQQQIIPRIWQHDPTVWQGDRAQIAKRLGWLDVLDTMPDAIAEVEDFAQDVRASGFTEAVVLGMGASSLAADVFADTFREAGELRLKVFDTTDPDFIQEKAKWLKPEETLFIVASKSGTTIETLCLLRHFYQWMQGHLPVSDNAHHPVGKHFAAITDAGTPLAHLASEYGFRKVFLNPPNIGGRYSVLSLFGLVPAALAGVDVRLLLDRARTMALACQQGADDLENPGLVLGATLAELAEAGRDKVTLVSTSAVFKLEDWLEQLLAESTGKQGKGIIPIAHEPLGLARAYSDDRLFVFLNVAESPDQAHERLLTDYIRHGHPVVRLRLQDRYDLAAQFFLWEMATAVVGHVLGINPFDQPDVEAAKRAARQLIESADREDRYTSEEEQGHSFVDDGMHVHGAPAPAKTAVEALQAFLEAAPERAYVAVQAFLSPDTEVDAALRSLAAQLRNRTGLPTMANFGPQYLHTTGQLHKGGPNTGLFIHLTSEPAEDIPVPQILDSSIPPVTFGALQQAESYADRQVLRQRNRRLIHFHLAVDPLGGINRLIAGLS